jgi:hypothetical protein
MLIEQINLVSNEWEMVGFFDDGEPAERLSTAIPSLVERLN